MQCGRTAGYCRNSVSVAGSQHGFPGTGDIAVLDALPDFLTVNADAFRRLDPDLVLVTADTEQGDDDVIADTDLFTNAARENKHVDYSSSSLWTEIIIAARRLPGNS